LPAPVTRAGSAPSRSAFLSDQEVYGPSVPLALKAASVEVKSSSSIVGDFQSPLADAVEGLFC
jgi:hypothetical protein